MPQNYRRFDIPELSGFTCQKREIFISTAASTPNPTCSSNTLFIKFQKANDTKRRLTLSETVFKRNIAIKYEMNRMMEKITKREA
jgi:hypothetical protein